MTYDENSKKKIERSNFKVNKSFLQEFKVLKKTHKILEIGCGAGSMTAHLTEQGFNITGTDVSKEMITYAKKAHPKAKYKLMDGARINFKDENFDVVLSFDLVEHIPNVEKHFQEVNRVLKPKGKYIFATPNKFVNRLYNFLKHKKFNHWKKYHPSLQSRNSLKKLCKKTGFQAEIKNPKAYKKYINSKVIFPINYIVRIIKTAIYTIATKK